MGKTVQKVRRNVTAPPGPGGAAVRFLPAHGGEQVCQGVMGRLLCRILHGGEIQGLAVCLKRFDDGGVLLAESEVGRGGVITPLTGPGTGRIKAICPATQRFGVAESQRNIHFKALGLNQNTKFTIIISAVTQRIDTLAGHGNGDGFHLLLGVRVIDAASVGMLTDVHRNGDHRQYDGEKGDKNDQQKYVFAFPHGDSFLLEA